MKMKILAAFAGAVVVAAGCVSTVSDTHTFAVSPVARDSVADRYNRPLDVVYKASVAVINDNGALVTEYVPHDYTNEVRSLEGRVNNRKVWIRVEQVDPKLSQVDVQARTTMGRSDLDLAHEIAKDIALKLASE